MSRLRMADQLHSHILVTSHHIHSSWLSLWRNTLAPVRGWDLALMLSHDLIRSTAADTKGINSPLQMVFAQFPISHLVLQNLM
jgi:hypothetical protein